VKGQTEPFTTSSQETERVDSFNLESTRRPGTGACTGHRKAKLLPMTSHMGQPLYEVSRKYHVTFSFASVLCKWIYNN